ncbi:SRPBCC family protein [Sorangium sp. So ce291]|uniref:SRPBCC family protein n=1 Tax=Sorangium sp. So ce291 TaxID=3133294 RepID=UPI003F63467E
MAPGMTARLQPERELLMSTVSTVVSTRIAVPRAPFFDWLVPGVFDTELHTVLRAGYGFPGTEWTSGTTGPWDVPGSYRTIHLTDGSTVREEVLVADAPDYFAYVVTNFTNPILRRLVKEARGQWWFTDDGPGTKAKWLYEFEGTSALATLVLTPVIKVFYKMYMTAGLQRIKERAEDELRGKVQ